MTKHVQLAYTIITEIINANTLCRKLLLQDFHDLQNSNRARKFIIPYFDNHDPFIIQVYEE